MLLIDWSAARLQGSSALAVLVGVLLALGLVLSAAGQDALAQAELPPTPNRGALPPPLGGPPPPVAAGETPRIVTEVRVEGNDTIPFEKIQPYLRLRAGREFQFSKVEADVRSLLGSRLFIDVKPLYQPTDEGVIVIFKVVERPVLTEILYLGNIRMRTSSLEKETGLKVGDSLDPAAIAEGRRKMLDLYERKGFNQVEIEIVEGLDPSDRRAVYRIHEGPKQRVQGVSFIGNSFVTSARLKFLINSQPAWFWLIGGEYDPQKVDLDVETLRSYYHGLGFWSVRISREVQMNAARTAVYLTFVIDEGPRFKVRDVSIIGNKQFSTEELMALLQLKAGDDFLQNTLEQDVVAMKDLCGSQGYIFADVQPDIRFLEEPGWLDVIYQVEEGERYRVGRINVKINGDYPHTKVTTVLNRMSLQPGDIIDVRKLRDSERRLKASGLFRNDPARGVSPRILFGTPNIPGDPTQVADRPGRPSVRGQDPGSTPGVGGAGYQSVTTPLAGPLAPGERLIDLTVDPAQLPPPREPVQPRVTASGLGSGARPHVGSDLILWRPGRPLVDEPPPMMEERTTPDQMLERPSLPDVMLGQPGAMLETDAHLPVVANAPARLTNAVAAAPPTARTSPVRPANSSPTGGRPVVRGQDWGAYQQMPQGRTWPPAPRRMQSPNGELPGLPPGYDPNPGAVPETFPDQQIPPEAAGRQPLANPGRGNAFQPGAPVQPGTPFQPGAPFQPGDGSEPPLLGDFGRDPAMTEPFQDLDIVVEETETGRLMFGAGFNSDAGVVGNIVLDEQNFDIARFPRSWDDFRNGTAFRGAGQRFRLEAAPGTEVSRYLVSFTDPYIFNTQNSFTISGSYYQRFFRDWNEERVDFRLMLGRQITPDLSLVGALRAEQIQIRDPSVPALPELAEVVGSNSLFGFRASLIHDTRDSPLLATEGHYWEMSFEQVVGDFEYPRVSLEARQYFLLYQRPDTSGRHTLSLRGQMAISGSNTPVYDNYFAGGFSSIRGFEFRGASPLRQGVTVGGEFLFLASAEYMFPITANDMLRGVVFVDSGTVEEDVRFDADTYRVAPGVGLRLTVPALGPAPIAIDFAFPVAQAEGDRDRIFNLYIGLTR